MTKSMDAMAAIKADVWRLHGSYSFGKLLKAFLLNRYFRPILSYRLFHAASALPHPLSKIVRLVLRLLHRRFTSRLCMQLPLECSIGPGLMLRHSYMLIINGSATIGSNVTFLHGVTIGGTLKGSPVLQDGVTVFTGAIIIGPINIGKGATVGAASLVVRDVPPLSVVGGNPARILGQDRQARTRNPAPWLVTADPVDGPVE